MSLRSLVILVSSCAALACGTTAEAPGLPVDDTRGLAGELQGGAHDGVEPSHRGRHRDIAPPRLVVFGSYSDRRFIDMMAAHHRMAVEMATVALERAQRPELRELAQHMIDAQTAEIQELRAIKEEVYGTSQLPTRMHPESEASSGMTSVEELERAEPFDLAFIDSMMPHHAGAIQMASVARRRSELAEIKTMSRSIIDAQAEEVGKMIAWRNQWYPGEP